MSWGLEKISEVLPETHEYFHHLNEGLKMMVDPKDGI